MTPLSLETVAPPYDSYFYQLHTRIVVRNKPNIAPAH
jgi:hypothetical protein